VVEVLSPSTTNVDRIRKLDEYKGHPTLAYIMLVDTRAPIVALYIRHDGDWDAVDFVGLEAVIDLPAVGVRLPLAVVFQGLTFT
jgi:Uma2 family endonuclease